MKKKLYLNTESKNNVMTIATLARFVKEYAVKEEGRPDPDRVFIKNLKTGCTYVNKALDEFIQSIDPNQAREMLEFIGSKEILITGKVEAKRIYNNKNILNDDEVAINRTALTEMCESIKNNCCSHCSGENVNCKFRNIMVITGQTGSSEFINCPFENF